MGKLLNKATAYQLKTKARRESNEDEVELLEAYLSGKIVRAQVNHALDSKVSVPVLNGTLWPALRYAYDQGMISFNRKK